MSAIRRFRSAGYPTSMVGHLKPINCNIVYRPMINTSTSRFLPMLNHSLWKISELDKNIIWACVRTIRITWVNGPTRWSSRPPPIFRYHHCTHLFYRQGDSLGLQRSFWSSLVCWWSWSILFWSPFSFWNVGELALRMIVLQLREPMKQKRIQSIFSNRWCRIYCSSDRHWRRWTSIHLITIRNTMMMRSNDRLFLRIHRAIWLDSLRIINTSKVILIFHLALFSSLSSSSTIQRTYHPMIFEPTRRTK